MNKKIGIGIRIIVFAIIFVYLFIHISYMCRGTLAHTRDNISGYYGIKENSLDVVLLGTSGTFSAFAPMEAYKECGYTSYNFAMNVMGINNMTYGLKELKKTQSPKLLVVDIYPYVRRNIITDGMDEYMIRYNTDAYKYSLNRFEVVKNIAPKADRLSYYLDIIKYHDNEFEWKNFYSETESINKGFNSLDYGVVEEPVMTSEVIALDEEADAYYTQLLEECKLLANANGTEILFVFFPYADFSKEVPWAMGNVNYMGERAKEYGFDFLNCQDNRSDYGLDVTKDYWDEGHFNIYGALKVTKVFGEALKTQYDLPDRRNDSAYSKWNDDITAWDNNVADYKTHIDELMAGYVATEEANN